MIVIIVLFLTFLVMQRKRASRKRTLGVMALVFLVIQLPSIVLILASQ